MRQIGEKDLNMQINIDRKYLSDGLMFFFSLMKANLTFTMNCFLNYRRKIILQSP